MPTDNGTPEGVDGTDEPGFLPDRVHAVENAITILPHLLDLLYTSKRQQMPPTKPGPGRQQNSNQSERLPRTRQTPFMLVLHCYSSKPSFEDALTLLISPLLGPSARLRSLCCSSACTLRTSTLFSKLSNEWDHIDPSCSPQSSLLLSSTDQFPFLTFAPNLPCPCL